jgi:hypothetical protein
MQKWFKLVLVALAVWAVVLAVAPSLTALAQDDPEEDPVLVEIRGVVEVLQEDMIVVSGVTIAPAGAFRPSDLKLGDQVIITGYLLPDDTLKAVSLQLVVDTDADGVLDFDDNCPLIANPDQADADLDGVGDLCEEDTDLDGVIDDLDNCPLIANPDQADADADGTGDLCEEDTDLDGIVDDLDNCPLVANPDQADADADGEGDACENDSDGDGILNDVDNCPLVANPDQADADADGVGDLCEEDTDLDGIVDDLDNCPLVANPDQADADADGVGDACDDDEGNTCDMRDDHPVALALAAEFDVEYEVIAGWRCDGFGFGEIARALLIAEQVEGTTADDILALRTDGLGWGQIKKDFEVDPGSLAPGRVISEQHRNRHQEQETAEGEDAPATVDGPGNSENAPGHSGNNPGHGGTPPGQNKDKDKGKKK